MSVLELAAAIISGAGVGWITNSIAVNMLFRKYGRWGGVIEEHYEEFIENMSQLVEADLVNHKTLHGEFNAPAFKAVLHIWIEDILRKELPEKSGSLRFEEIPGSEQSAAQLINLVQEFDPALTASIYRIFEHKEIQTVLSKEHYEYIVDTNVKAMVSKTAPYQQDLKAILYTFLSDRAVNTLLSQEAIDHITENITSSIQNIDFSQFDKAIDNTFNALLQCIGIDRLIGDLEQALGQMRFADFIKDSPHLSQDIVSRIIRFSKSPEGQSLLLETAAVLLDDAKTIQLKIDEAVSPELKAGIAAFINEKFPDIIEKIADFISESSDEIEQIINDAVDRHLEISADGILLKTFKDIFTGDLAKQFNAVNKIIDAVHKYGDTAGSRIAYELISFIETNSIGGFIGILQEQKILTPQSIVTLINYSLQNMPEKDYNMIEKLLYTKISSNFKPDLSKIKTVLLPQIFDKIKQDYLYRNTFKQDLQSKVTEKITETVQKKCGTFLSSEHIPLPLKEQPIKNALLNLWDQISIKKIGALIPEKLTKNLHINWKSLWNRHKHRKLNQAYQAIQNGAVYTKTAEGITDILNQHLDKIVTGNVSALVRKELKKSSPSQIRAMVQDFMGKELKPINGFGAFLGALAGGVSVWAASLLGGPREFTWQMLLVYGAVFGAVGIGTNWLAIKMLFRPYKKIVFNVSPFIGVAAARKKEFAESISHFIKNRTLNDAVLTQFFSKNKNSLQEKSSAWIADSDYAVIDNIFRDDQRLDTITGFIFSAIQAYSTRHSADAAESIVKLLKDLTESGKLDNYLPLLRDGIMQKLGEKDVELYVHTFLKKEIEREIEGKKLGHYTKALSNAADLQLNNIFKTLADTVTPEKIKQLIYQQNDRFVSYISTHSFEDFAGTPVTAGLAQGISEKTGEALHTAVGPIVKYFEDHELNPDTKLGNLFNRKIAELIEKHITYFIDLVSQEIGTQKGALVKQIKDAMPWYAAPAKGHIAPVMDLLIDKELPEFLRRKKEKILSVPNELLEYRLSHLGFNEDTLKTAVIEQAVSGVLNSPGVQQRVTHFVQVIAEQYTRVPLKSILAILNITAIQDLVTIAEPLLDPAVSYIKFRLLQDDAAALMAKFAKDVIEEIAVSDLLAGVDLEKELQRLIALVLNDTAAMDAVSRLLLTMLRNIIKDSNSYDDAMLRKDIKNFIFSAPELEQDWESLRLTCIPLLKTFFQRLNKSITAETKQAVCREYLIPAVLNAAENHFNALIHSIDIQKVVEREVNAMHPREIEALFNKFAGTYFTKITLYGWIGVFGGLLSYIISCLLEWFR